MPNHTMGDVWGGYGLAGIPPQSHDTTATTSIDDKLFVVQMLDSCNTLTFFGLLFLEYRKSLTNEGFIEMFMLQSMGIFLILFVCLIW